ncbi:MAG: 4Fe-4S binding protein, partial [Desulfurococcales archaeon]|nr:4Fe-4S binding protein [Desulfurococcales archaeon]
YWSQLAIYLYIAKHRLPLNPLYMKGFDRLGCFMCPAANIAEYREVKKAHPQLWSRWESILYRWAERLGLRGKDAKLWVEKGVWRWLTPAAQKRRLAQRIRIDVPEWNVYYTRWLRPSAILVDKDDGVEIRFSGSIDNRFLDDQYSVLGPFKPSTERKEYIIEGTGVSISVYDGKITVKGLKGRAARELAYDVLKVYYRWTYCGECRLCETSCPTGAIRVVDGKPRVDDGKCIHCKLCIDNCPVADVSVERITVALNEGNITAWRRPWKRSRESIIKRYLRLKHPYHIEEGGEEDLEEKGFYLGG